MYEYTYIEVFIMTLIRIVWNEKGLEDRVTRS